MPWHNGKFSPNPQIVANGTGFTRKPIDPMCMESKCYDGFIDKWYDGKHYAVVCRKCKPLLYAQLIKFPNPWERSIAQILALGEAIAEAYQNERDMKLKKAKK